MLFRSLSLLPRAGEQELRLPFAVEQVLVATVRGGYHPTKPRRELWAVAWHSGAEASLIATPMAETAVRLSRFKSRAFGGTLSVTLDSDAYAAAWTFAARRREQALTRAVARLLVIGGTPPRHLSCGTTQCATEAAQSGPVTGYDQAAVIAPAIQPGRRELVETHVQDLCAGLMRSCLSALCQIGRASCRERV